MNKQARGGRATGRRPWITRVAAVHFPAGAHDDGLGNQASGGRLIGQTEA